MKFLNKYECEDLEDGNLELSLIPVEQFENITIYVHQEPEFITIFDGGSTANALRMIYNFSSKQFQKALEEICKKYEISIDEEVFFTECDESEFDERLKAFMDGLNAICEI